jgi:hypothetical protein
MQAILSDDERAAREVGRARLVHEKDAGGSDVAPPATAAGDCRMALDLLRAVQIVMQGLPSLHDVGMVGAVAREPVPESLLVDVLTQSDRASASGATPPETRRTEPAPALVGPHRGSSPPTEVQDAHATEGARRNVASVSAIVLPERMPVQPTERVVSDAPAAKTRGGQPPPTKVVRKPAGRVGSSTPSRTCLRSESEEAPGRVPPSRRCPRSESAEAPVRFGGSAGPSRRKRRAESEVPAIRVGRSAGPSRRCPRSEAGPSRTAVAVRRASGWLIAARERNYLPVLARGSGSHGSSLGVDATGLRCGDQPRREHHRPETLRACSPRHATMRQAPPAAPSGLELIRSRPRNNTKSHTTKALSPLVEGVQQGPSSSA